MTRWAQPEIAILDEAYPRVGAIGAAELLPGRTIQSIQQKAFKRRLSAPTISDAPKPLLTGELLEDAIRLRQEGWPFMRIARHLDMNEAATTNAILIALCPRMGFRPAERDETGRLLPEGVERLRYMLKKGLKAVDIQLRLGLSSSRISLERRRYNADLASRGKALLPPPGGGEQYSGVRIPAAKRKEVEALLLAGHGAPTAAQKVGVSRAAAKHIRTRLLKRLRRKGETLTGCDQDGRRIGRAKESRHFIPADAVLALRQRLMSGEPVSVAARAVGIGSCGAYRIRDALRADLAAEGRELPKPIRLGRNAAQRARAREASWLPTDRLQEFRSLSHEHGLEEARRLMEARLAAEREAAAAARAEQRARPKTFEEQLAMVSAGRGLVRKFVPRRSDPDMTLGGVATGAL